MIIKSFKLLALCLLCANPLLAETDTPREKKILEAQAQRCIDGKCKDFYNENYETLKKISENEFIQASCIKSSHSLKGESKNSCSIKQPSPEDLAKNFNEVAQCMGVSPKKLFPIIHHEGRFVQGVTRKNQKADKFAELCPAQLTSAAMKDVNEVFLKQKPKKSFHGCIGDDYLENMMKNDRDIEGLNKNTENLFALSGKGKRCEFLKNPKACFAYSAGYYLISEWEIRKALEGNNKARKNLSKLKKSSEFKEHWEENKEKYINYCATWNYNLGRSPNANFESGNHTPKVCLLELLRVAENTVKTNDEILAELTTDLKNLQKKNPQKAHKVKVTDSGKVEKSLGCLAESRSKTERDNCFTVPSYMNRLLKDAKNASLKSYVLEIKAQVKEHEKDAKVDENTLKSLEKVFKEFLKKPYSYRAILAHLEGQLKDFCTEQTLNKETCGVICSILKNTNKKQKACFYEKSFLQGFLDHKHTYCKSEK